MAMTSVTDWYRDPTTLLEELKQAPRRHTRPLSIDGYEDTRLLKRGGQGAVYTAVQQSTRRRVAIKVLYEETAGSTSHRRRFEREIDLVAGLVHPHIVRIYDSGLTPDGRLYFVMEYVDGGSLSEYVAARSELSLRQRLQVFAPICAAVHFAHQHGIIHRDLKPSNIRIDPQGQPHILDFGIAKISTPDDGAAMTLTGQFLGTLAYASPEQVQRDPASVDVRSDVYSLGVILYEMLTGERPYASVGPVAQMISAITSLEAQPPSRRLGPRGDASPKGDKELDTIVLKALCKDPVRRYQSAAALQQDVLHYLAGDALDARRDSTWYVFRKTLVRHKLPTALGAAFVLVLIASTIALSVMYRRARLEADKASQIKIFLEDTLGSVEASDEGHDVTIRETLDEAVHWVDIALTGQPEVEASLRNTIGNSYRALGLHDRAETALQQALEIRRKLWGARHVQVAQSLNSLGLLRSDQGRLQEAEQLFRDALPMQRQLLGDRHPDITHNLMNLASLLADREEFGEAEHLYEEALAIRRAAFGEQHPDVAMCFFRMATLEEARGDSARAIQLHRAALDIRRLRLHAEHPDLARSLLALGSLLVNAGEPGAAEPLLRECVQIRMKLLPAAHWRITEAQAELDACLSELSQAEPIGQP